MKKTVVAVLIGILLFPSLAFAQYHPDPQINSLISLLMQQVEFLKEQLALLNEEETKREEKEIKNISTADSCLDDIISINKKVRDARTELSLEKYNIAKGGGLAKIVEGRIEQASRIAYEKISALENQQRVLKDTCRNQYGGETIAELSVRLKNMDKYNTTLQKSVDKCLSQPIKVAQGSALAQQQYESELCHIMSEDLIINRQNATDLRNYLQLYTVTSRDPIQDRAKEMEKWRASIQLLPTCKSLVDELGTCRDPQYPDCRFTKKDYSGEYSKSCKKF